jgi:ribonuclease VapC
MVVDTSALVALFLREPGHDIIADLVDDAQRAYMSVVTRVELTAVLCGRRLAADPVRVSEFVDALHLDPVPVTYEQMTLAVEALLTFGKGRHPAGLNLGDCFAYALAKSLGAPLLFKGEDFANTDITPAWRPGRVRTDAQQP